MTIANKLPRLRFTLRTAFLVVTIVSVAAAILIAHHRRAAAIESWDRALRNAICENIARLPDGGKFTDPPDVLANKSVAPLADIDQSPRLTNDDLAPLTYWSPTAMLDVTEALQNESPADLAERLIRHYEAGFERHGLIRKTVQLCAFGPDSTQPSSVWLTERPELGGMVTVEVRVDESAQTAAIQIRHVARPNHGLW
jgi:hypothetical protein